MSLTRLALTAIISLTAAFSAHAADDGFVSIFNGKDLTGWEGDNRWSVVDGAILGEVKADNLLKYNMFLIYRADQPGDFELKAMFKLEGGNSGIQYRAHDNPEAGPFSIGGYQADFDPTNRYTGICYEEKGRGIFSQRGYKTWIMPDGTKFQKQMMDPDKVAAAVKLGDWNEYHIIADGNHVIQKINGVTTTEFIDHQADKRALKGLIALQMHVGGPMKVQFKNVMIKKLPAGNILSPEQAAPPAEAEKIGGPAPKKAGKKKAEAAPAPSPAKAQASAAPPAKASGPVPQWIWLGKKAEGEQRLFFRKQIPLSGKLESAQLTATGDDAVVVFVNGVKVLENKSWQNPKTADVAFAVGGDKLVIAAEAANKNSAGAILLAFTIKSKGQPPVKVATDSTWSVTDKAQGDWKKPGYDDASWKKATVIAPLGGGPWAGVAQKMGAAANVAKADPKKKQARRRDDGEGPEPAATDPATLKLLPGYKAELLYSVPKGQQGSWVNICFDDKGRLITSDQNGILYRLTIDKPEKGKVVVEPLDVKYAADAEGKKVESIGGAHGLCWAFDSLYVMVSDGKSPHGLYRLRSTRNNEVFDEVKLLKELKGGGEHGPHAVIPSPDGKGLYVVAGNHTDVPEFDNTLLPKTWQEDQLPPRMPDANGHAATRMAPGGWIARIDPEGKSWTLLSSGYRNQFDVAVNRAGDLFTYDSDMEWDIGLPWYRPTRVNHAVSGSEFGWRNGSGKWPVWYPDSLPPAADIGPGSPTGVAFGYGAKFPAKYQNAFFISDWSYGNLFAVHLTPSGASYSATHEKFISGRPFPITDVAIGPDGAMYFTLGGRKTKSGLYRVTYTGPESTAAAQPVPADAATARLHDLRRKLESFHGRRDPAAVGAAWPHLGHADRFIRYAARIAVENQPVALWRDKALSEKDPQAAITAAVALARCGDKSQQGKLLESLDRLSVDSLSEAQQLEMLRAYELVFIRMGEPGKDAAAKVAAKFQGHFPSSSKALNRQISAMLIHLKAPGAIDKVLARQASEAADPAEQIWHAYVLRTSAPEGWSMDQLKQLFGWFGKSAAFKGGHSAPKYIENMKKEVVARLSDEQKKELAPLMEKKPDESASVMAALMTRGLVKAYTVDELAPIVDKGLMGRNFQQGKRMYATAACSVCHNFDNSGGTIGPDLTGVGNRFSNRDLLESIIEPGKVISDQYQQTIFTMNDGKVVVGRVINMSGNSMRVNTSMFDNDQAEGVDVTKLKSQMPSPVSPMPPGLLNMLKEEEILDLIAYLKSGGNREDPMFK